MKYMVMECHKAYAVLMDEDSRFVHAANMRYKVGQIVNDPVIMEQNSSSARNIKMTVSSAAACAVLIAGTGYKYYTDNFKPHSSIIISSEAKITMELNSKGEVIALKGDNADGREILKGYTAKSKDKATVAKDIIKIEKAKGIINENDTIEFVVSSDDPEKVKILQREMNDIKSKINEHRIKTDTDKADTEIPKEKVTEIKAPAAEPKVTSPPVSAVPKDAEKNVKAADKAKPSAPTIPAVTQAPAQERTPTVTEAPKANEYPASQKAKEANRTDRMTKKAEKAKRAAEKSQKEQQAKLEAEKAKQAKIESEKAEKAENAKRAAEKFQKEQQAKLEAEKAKEAKRPAEKSEYEDHRRWNYPAAVPHEQFTEQPTCPVCESNDCTSDQ